ncbi:MAG: HlyC/CorC family transporter [Rickettsiales bacterium]|nr:HlyC/CorC family transporter [Rickettsiales bacterium]
MDLETSLHLLAIFVLILCSGFFSGSETGLTAVSRARIFQLMKENNRRAKLVGKLRQEKESLIGAILLGNNLVNILASALATSLAISLWGEVGVVYATIAMTSLVLVFAEVLPKTFAIKRSEQVSLAVAPVIAICVTLFSPVTLAVKWFITQIFALFGIDVCEENALMPATDLLRGTIEMHHREGQMEKQDRDMLDSILELKEIEVEEVMVHRKQVEGLDIAEEVSTIIDTAINSPHSRLPVYEGEYTNVVGILHLKTLLRLIHKRGRANITRKDIRSILLKPWFIPSTTSLKEQLYAFRQKRQHFALVVDEYGDLQGIVTLEDVIEEIVGEIDDEYDTIDLSGIVELSSDTWMVEGNTGIRDLNRHLDWELPDEDANTIAGLVLQEARDIPTKGEVFETAGCRFIVEACTPTQITRVRIEKLETPPEGDE